MSRKTMRVFSLISILWIVSVAKNSFAQIIPDSSTNSTSDIQSVDNNTITIKGGIKQGKNLFHEFRKFNISSSDSVVFNNPKLIDNIIATIQNKNPSNIDGSISVNGPANLFLLNPSGFVFGPNSSIELQGSFLVSTAEKIGFSDGFTYFTRRTRQPILTIGKPVKFTLNRNSGAINIKGSGHQKIFESLQGGSFLGVISDGKTKPSGLKISQNKSISFTGNGINFNGGAILSSQGDVLINSISDGEVNFVNSSSGPSFNYAGVKYFSDIVLDKKSLIETNGFLDTKTNLYGENIYITNGSLILNKTINNLERSSISINSNKLLLIQGTNDSNLFDRSNIPSNIKSSITSQNLNGNGTDILVDAGEVVLKDGGTITALSLFSGSTGDIRIDSLKKISVLGFSDLNPVQAFSSIGTGAFGSSIGGSISLNTIDVLVKRTGAITSGNFGSTQGGDININATRRVSVEGFNPVTFGPSVISSLSFSSGDAGNVSIDTKDLYISNGGGISTSTLSSGNSGDISINTLSLLVDGKTENPSLNEASLVTGISASGSVVRPLFQELLGLPPFPSGNAGSILIESQDIQVSNGGAIIVNNDGTGDAGNTNISTRNLSLFNSSTIAARTGTGNAGDLEISANNITLEDNSQISGATKGGKGGNVTIFSGSTLLRNSSITGSAAKKGDGGNISVNTDLIVATGDSNLTAEAEEGQGGDISITAQAAIFGPDVKFSVSSDAGVQSDGTIIFNVKKTGAEETTAPAPDVNQAPKIISACNPSGKVSEFVVLGTGGLQEDTQSEQSKDLKWNTETSDLATLPPETELPKAPLVEAQGWQKLDDRRVMLTANPQNSNNKVAAHPTPCNQPS